MASKGSVLVLGAGLVTKPLVHYLSEHGWNVILASRTLENAQKLVEGASHTEVHQFDITNSDHSLLDALTQRSVAVISMLPYIYHAAAAKVAIKHKKHFLTTSYVSDAMRSLEAEAKAAGIVMLNECGVDPGTDHMSALKIIDDVHAKGGKIVSFTSYCGGLPHPKDNDNPLGYKFSWAPRGVLLAAKNDAIFMRDGKEVKIPAGTLYDSVESFNVDGVGKFDGYGNRNSLNYVNIYRIPETKEIIRGTFRYHGWCATLRKLIDVGYLSEAEHAGLPGKTYAKLTAELIGAPDAADVRGATASRLQLASDSEIMKALDFIGVFSSDIVVTAKSPIDALVATMLPKMQYKSGEQDMIFMQHKLRIEYPSQNKAETIISRMVSYGDDKIGSAMSRTVSYPVAIATRLLLDGIVKLEPGLVIPSTPELYNPILEELRTKFGITWSETSSVESL